MDQRARLVLRVLWVGIIVFYFWDLWGGSLRQWDEALTAERSREILATGDWLTPHFGFQPDFNKPPLYYWLTAITFKVFGIDEFSARLWSVLFGLGCMILVYRLANKTGSAPWSGLIALFLLATNSHWMNKTREGLLDSGMLFGMLAAIWFLSYGSQRARRGISAGVCLAIGTMVKGPVALFALVVPLWNRFVARKEKCPLGKIAGALVVAAVLTLPWYAFQYAKYAAMFSSALVSRSTLTRFLTPIDSNTGGPLFFLLGWPRLAPVAFVLFVAPVVYFLSFDRKKMAAASPFIFLTLLFFVAVSLSASKRDLYLVLLHPSAAIAAGVLLVEFQQSLKTRRLQSVAPVLLVVLALAGFVPFYVAKPDYAHHLKETGRKLKKVAKARDSIAAVEIPLNNLLFYSRKPVEYIRYSSLKDRYSVLVRDGHRTMFFVVKTKEVKRFSTLVDSLGAVSLRKKIVHKNRRFTIVAIQAGGKI